MITKGESRPAELHLKGGPVGILLIHGLTGSTTEMSLIADYLHHQGLTVLAPLLPGHGTSPADLNTKRWPDWAAHVKQSLERLSEECQTLFVGGLSLGALLSLYAAATWPSIHGVIAYSTPLPIAHARSYLFPLKYLVPSLLKPKDYFADPNAQAGLWNYSVAPLRAYYELLKFIKIVRANLHENSLSDPCRSQHRGFHSPPNKCSKRSGRRKLESEGAVDSSQLRPCSHFGCRMETGCRNYLPFHEEALSS